MIDRILLLLLSCASVLAAPPVQFDGQQFACVFNHRAEATGAITREYLRKGESLKKWKVMVSVRYYPNVTSPKAIAVSWLKMLESSNLPGHSVRQEKVEGATDDQEMMFFASLRAPDDSYLELCWCRVVDDPWSEGIKMYQVSRKVNPKQEKELMAALLASTSWTTQLQAMFIDPTKE